MSERRIFLKSASLLPLAVLPGLAHGEAVDDDQPTAGWRRYPKCRIYRRARQHKSSRFRLSLVGQRRQRRESVWGWHPAEETAGKQSAAAGRTAGASRTREPENHVRIHALRRRISSANGAGSRTILTGGWSQWSQVSGFTEHRTCDVRCSRMRGLTSVGEWLSLVEHLVRDQGVGGSNPLSPTNLFKRLQQIHLGATSVREVVAVGNRRTAGRTR